MNLASYLVRIGATAGRRAESGGIRFAALAFAALTLTAASAAFVTAVQVSAARADRMSAASYVAEDPGRPRSDVLLATEVFDNLENGRQFPVFYITPVGDAPLPPGLHAWPEPGAVFVSPELLAEGSHEDIEHRYGAVAGTLDITELADETQLIAYVRPVEPLAYPQDYGSVEVISSFGDGDPGGWNWFWLLSNQDMAAYALPVGLLVLLLVPSLLFTVIAARTSAHARDRRDQLVMVLGGRPVDRAWLAFGESWLPITLGALAGAALVFAGSRGFRIPYVDYVVSGGDLVDARVWLALCPVLGWAVVLAAAVGLANRQRKQATRPRNAPDSTRMVVRMAVCAIAVFLSAVAAGWIPAGSAARPLLIFVSIGVILATLPSAVAVCASWLSHRVVRRARDRLSAGVLVGGRRVVVQVGAVARQIAGLASATVLLCFCLAFMGTLSSYTAEAEQFVDEVGSKLVLVTPRGEHAPDAAAAYRSVMGPEYGMVAVMMEMSDDGEETLYVYGECRDLEALALQCPEAATTAELGLDELADPRVDAMLSTFTDKAVVGQGDLDDGLERTGGLAVFRFDGGSPSVPSLKETGSEYFQLGVGADILGGDWITGAAPGKEQGRWVMLFAVAGLGMLALATAVGSASEFLRSAKRLAPLTTLSGGRTVFRLSSAVTVLVPMVVAVGLGLIVGQWSTRVLRTMGTDLLTWEFAAQCAVAVSVVGAVMWWWASSVAIREASRWRPGRSD